MVEIKTIFPVWSDAQVKKVSVRQASLVLHTIIWPKIHTLYYFKNLYAFVMMLMLTRPRNWPFISIKKNKFR